MIPIMLYAETYIDSLKLELLKSSDQVRVQILKTITEYFAINSPDSTIEYCQTGLSLARSMGDSIHIGFFSIQLSQILYTKGLIKKAIDYTKDALNYFESNKDSLQIANTCLTLSVYYFDECDLDSAKIYLNKSKNIFKSLNDTHGLLSCNSTESSIELFLSNYYRAMENNLIALARYSEAKNNFTLAILLYDAGQIYYDVKNYSKSMDYFQQALEIFLNEGSNFFLGLCYVSIGRIYYSFSQLDSAKIYAQRGYDIFKKVNYEIHYPFFLNVLGNIELAAGNSKNAVDFYKESLLLAKKHHNKWYESYSLQRLGYYYFLREEYDRAIRLYLESNILSKKIKSKDISLDNHYFLSKCYIITGQNSLAIENLNKYISLKDSIFFMNQHDITELQVTYHTENVKKEKDLLQKDNAILKLEAEKQKLLKTRFLLGFALVTLLAVIVFYLYRHKQRHNRILQQRIEEALKQQREQQAIITHQAGLTTLGELTAGVVHEINQPLQSITLCAEGIGLENKEKLPPNEEISRNVQDIAGYIDRIRSIMEHIRLFSSGQQEEYCQKFNINECIENAFRMIRLQLNQRGITVKQEIPGELPVVSGNPYQYERVVLNLILNARDALEEKGKRVNGGYLKEIIIKSNCKTNDVILEVLDNGIGIEEKQRSKIFEAFYSTKKLGEGQGLGLSIANRTIKGMGGRIEVESEVLVGTTMRVVVPVFHENLGFPEK